jgi:hypothetical protein
VHGKQERRSIQENDREAVERILEQITISD